MLNFGRNLATPAEAYYHGLFLLAILWLSQKRLGAALAIGALLSISHPFTGLSLALILTAYAMAMASTICGALLAENGRTFRQSSLFVGQQWLWFYVAVMLSAFVWGRFTKKSDRR